MAGQKKQTAGLKPARPMRHVASGPAPILEGEDSKAYDELLARVSGTMKPKDAIEEFWVSDIVDLTWEIFRYRRYKTSLIKAAFRKALEEILEPIHNGIIEANDMPVEKAQLKLHSRPTPTEKLIHRWMQQEDRVNEGINTMLGLANLTMDDVNARAMALAINDIDRVDRLLSRAEASRNAVLREIERRRDTFAERLRRAVRDVEEGEFEKVEPKAITLESAAE